MAKLLGKVALITGASSGIGKATALLFAQRGLQVMLTGRNKEALAQVVDKCGDSKRAKFLPGDLMDIDFIPFLIDATIEQFGRIDILVNNAGFTEHVSGLEEETFEGWQATMQLNLNAVMLLCKHAMPHLKKSVGGAIVNVSSIVAAKPTKGHISYSVSKGALDQLTRCVALEAADFGVRRNVTQRPGETLDEQRARLALLHPLGKRLGTCDEVARAIAFLASDEASFCTGNTLYVDGGRFLT